MENDLLLEQEDHPFFLWVGLLCALRLLLSLRRCCLLRCVLLSSLLVPCESDLSSEFSSLCLCAGNLCEVHNSCDGIAETYVLAFVFARCPFLASVGVWFFFVVSGVVWSSLAVAFARLTPAEKQVAPAVPCGAAACLTISTCVQVVCGFSLSASIHVYVCGFSCLFVLYFVSQANLSAVQATKFLASC